MDPLVVASRSTRPCNLGRGSGDHRRVVHALVNIYRISDFRGGVVVSIVIIFVLQARLILGQDVPVRAPVDAPFVSIG